VRSKATRIWRTGLATAALLGLAHIAWASSQPAPQKDIAAGTDATDRMTVGVSIDGRGPFPFVVDTGAERTVISTELAAQLRLAAAPAARLLSLSEESTVPAVLIPRLAVSDTVVEAINAPALARDHLGAAGILGIDTLQKQRVVFDFKRGRMTVSPAAQREEYGYGEEIVVRARSRFGRLVLADATAEGQKVHVIIDSGAQISVGNPALLTQLARRSKHGPALIEVTSVTGGTMIAKVALLRKVRIGGINLEHMPVAIADSGVFHKLGLENRPALLLGMDVLRSFDRVSIDFANRKVRFLLPGEAMFRAPIRSATDMERKAAADVS
jgi:predicted aspartyl protease